MGTLIALQTIHGAITEPLFDKGGEPLRDARGRHRHRQVEPVLIEPGREFDPAKLGIDDAEAKSLVASGAVREMGKLEAAERSALKDLTLHPPAGGGIDAELPSEDELEKMSRADLDDLAEKRGLDPSKARNKAEMIDMLVASAI